MPDAHLIYLSIGSNLGARAANLNRAIAALPDAGAKVLRQSSFYETEPVDFLNCVVEAETSLSPKELLAGLQGIERRMKSKKLVARGPRIIDLDVLFYDGIVVRENAIEIPHPRMAERRFVLVPLAELAPALRHPVLHATMAELLASTPDKSIVRIWHPNPNEPSSNQV